MKRKTGFPLAFRSFCATFAVDYGNKQETADSDYQLYKLGYRHTDYSEVMPYLWLFWLVCAIISLIGAMWNMKKEMIVTNLRVVAKSGLISTNIKELKLSKVESVDLKKDHLANSGSVIVRGASSKMRIDGIENPEAFYNLCRKAVDDFTSSSL